MIRPLYTDSPLGRALPAPTGYDPALLYPIARADARFGLDLPLPTHGADIWNAYELSWLDARGKPVVAMGRFTFPLGSPRLIESKSLKLYLNSYNEERFEHADIVRMRLQTDLARAAGAAVHVEIMSVRPAFELSCRPLPGRCIDDLELPDGPEPWGPAHLRHTEPAPFLRETLVSELLKSNCPVTGQPDWASLQIRYAGPRIDPAGLLAYLVSLRGQQEFHELCVEKIYGEIMRRCQPRELMVYARYTRRGGLDINPWRANHPPEAIDHGRTLRQ